MHSGLDRILSFFFVIASRHARYMLHQVLKHILEEVSESDNVSSEDKEEGTERFIQSDVPNAGPRTKAQVLARGASFGAPGDIRILTLQTKMAVPETKKGTSMTATVTHPVFMIYKQMSTLKATPIPTLKATQSLIPTLKATQSLIPTLKATQSLKSTTDCLGTGILPAFL